MIKLIAGIKPKNNQSKIVLKIMKIRHNSKKMRTITKIRIMILSSNLKI